MILIISDTDDSYTHGIIEWLKFYECDYDRISFNQLDCSNVKIKFDANQFDIEFCVGDKTIAFSQVAYFLFRGSRMNKKAIADFSDFFDEEIGKTYLSLEEETIIDFIYEQINAKSIGWIQSKPLNKLVQIQLAQSAGLSVPESIITAEKSDLKEPFFVTKAIQENVAYQDDNMIYLQRVKKVNLEELPQQFFPSLFQECVNRTIEIRTFYLDGRFYSIGSFCEKLTEDIVDIREIQKEQDYFRVSLPNEIEEKLDHLMKKIGLVAGSIDLGYNQDGDYVFFEVNPEGQFEWVSLFGNYHIEREIALFLKNQLNQTVTPNENN